MSTIPAPAPRLTRELTLSYLGELLFNAGFIDERQKGEVDAAEQRREGGKPQTPALGATPLPNPPPQGGRGRTARAASSRTTIHTHAPTTFSRSAVLAR